VETLIDDSIDFPTIEDPSLYCQIRMVEKEGDELNELSPIFTGVELYSPSPAESLLGYRFINFHRCLNQARVRLQELGAGTAIVFSDSAFFRTDSLENAIQILYRRFDFLGSHGSCFI